MPYSVKAVNPIGAGFVELVGPGKTKVNTKAVLHKGTKYISTKNINSMNSASGTSQGCVLRYSSENDVKNISVTTQSCNAIISVFNIVNK